MTQVSRLALVLSLGSISALTACSDDPESASAADAGADEGSSTDADVAPEPDVASDTAADIPAADTVEDVSTELTITEADFECLTDWEPVRGFFLTNLLGNTAESVRVAEGGFAEPAPVGTVIQLVPIEAMVKLPAGSSPSTNDWEYFLLQNNPSGSTITERGFEEVSNLAGTCNSCHANAAERDFVCEDTGLCAAAALPRDLVDQMVESDPRCD